MDWSKLDFKEFDQLGFDAWKEKATKDLKGKPLDDITWRTEEDLMIEAYFSKDHQLQQILVPPRSNNFTNADWQMREKFLLGSNEDILNKAILESLEHGVGAISLKSDSAAEIDLGTILNGVYLDMIEMYISPGKNNQNLKAILEIQEQMMLDQKQFSGGWLFDPLTELEENGVADLDQYMQEFADLMRFAQSDFRSWKCVNIDAELYYNAGASSSQEIAFALGKGLFYMSQMMAMGVPADAAAATIQFSFSVGTSYFKNAAKIRAFRFLWSKVAALFGIEHLYSLLTWVNTTSAEFEITSVEAENNYLRMTTETMASVVGGADSITSFANPKIWGDKIELARRTIRNIQHIVKEESYFAQVKDPGKGSYYLEAWTSLLAEKSWALFQEICKQGGMIECITNGFVLHQIGLSRDQLISDVNKGERTILGVNKFQNETTSIHVENGKENLPENVIRALDPIAITNQKAES